MAKWPEIPSSTALMFSGYQDELIVNYSSHILSTIIFLMQNVSCMLNVRNNIDAHADAVFAYLKKRWNTGISTDTPLLNSDHAISNIKYQQR